MQQKKKKKRRSLSVEMDFKPQCKLLVMHHAVLCLPSQNLLVIKK